MYPERIGKTMIDMRHKQNSPVEWFHQFIYLRNQVLLKSDLRNRNKLGKTLNMVVQNIDHQTGDDWTTFCPLIDSLKASIIQHQIFIDLRLQKFLQFLRRKRAQRQV